MFFMKSHMVNSVEYILYYKIGLYFFYVVYLLYEEFRLIDLIKLSIYPGFKRKVVLASFFRWHHISDLFCQTSNMSKIALSSKVFGRILWRQCAISSSGNGRRHKSSEYVFVYYLFVSCSKYLL